MKTFLRFSLLAGLFLCACFLRQANAAKRQPLSPAFLQAAPAADPIVGTYDSVRYGTTFKFLPDGTILGTDGLGDGTWQATDSAHHKYTVKIRPSKMDSPERSETWNVVLEKEGLIDGNQSTIFSRAM